MRSLIFAIALCLGGMAHADPARDLGSPGLAATSDATEICGKTKGLTYTKQHRSGTVERSLHCPKGWQSDHQLPLAAGGADDVRNLHCQPPDSLAAGHLGWKAKDGLDDWAWQQICHKGTDAKTIQALFLAPAKWQDGYCKVSPDDKRC